MGTIQTLARRIVRGSYRRINDASRPFTPILENCIADLKLAGFVRDEARRHEILTTVARRRIREGDFKKAAFVWEQLADKGAKGNAARYDAISGLLWLFELDTGRGPKRAAAGLGSPVSNPMTHLRVISFPRPLKRWLEENSVRFNDAHFWTDLVRSAEATHSSTQLFRERIAAIMYLIGERGLASTLSKRASADQLKSAADATLALQPGAKSSKWFKLPVAMPDWLLANDEDVDLAVVCDWISRADQGLPPRSIDDYLAKSTLSPQLRTLVESDDVWVLTAAFQAMQRQDYSGALNVLEPQLQKYQPLFEQLDALPDIKKIFFCGFGWSGSGAVHDAIRAYPTTSEMPGASNAPYLNDGAETEPMYLQGPFGFGELRLHLSSVLEPNAGRLWSFFRLYVLGMQPHTYLEYKAVCATQQLHKLLGSSYFGLILDLVASICRERAKRQSMERPGLFPSEPFMLFTDRLTKVLSPADTGHMLFNNAVFSFNIAYMDLVRNAAFVAVGRDVRDQFVDQRRFNKGFNENAVIFNKRISLNMKKYRSGVKKLNSKRPDLLSQYVQFESFVLDADYRERVVTTLMGRYDAVAEAKHFDPQRSSRNIGIYSDILSAREVAGLGGEIKIFESAPLLQQRVA